MNESVYKDKNLARASRLGLIMIRNPRRDTPFNYFADTLGWPTYLSANGNSFKRIDC